VNANLEHSCWSAEYLLAHCEGYRVESAGGTRGYVEEIVSAPDESRPLALLVRPAAGRSGLFVIPTDNVLELRPDTESLVVRAPNEHDRPLDRGERRRPRTTSLVTFTPAARSMVGSLSR
jgi:hypothetical protein